LERPTPNLKKHSPPLLARVFPGKPESRFFREQGALFRLPTVGPRHPRIACIARRAQARARNPVISTRTRPRSSPLAFPHTSTREARWRSHRHLPATSSRLARWRLARGRSRLPCGSRRRPSPRSGAISRSRSSPKANAAEAAAEAEAEEVRALERHRRTTRPRHPRCSFSKRASFPFSGTFACAHADAPQPDLST